MEIVFLGSGGGRFITITQFRSTGGFFISADKRIHVDPGPGALIRSWRYKLDPRKLEAIFISHRHVDHCNDTEVMVEGMTIGVTKKRGILIASKSVIEGDETHTPAISKYHLNSLEKVYRAVPGDEIFLGEDKMTITPTIHSDPTTIGFRLEAKEGIISYIPDTEYFDEMREIYSGSRIIIASVTRPKDMKIPYHMTTEDAVYMLKKMEEKPELFVISHVGMKMHFANPYKEAQFIQNVTGIKTIVAKEGLKLRITEKGISLKTLRPARFV